MELSREELLLTAMELDKHNGTKNDYANALVLVASHTAKLVEFFKVVKTYCGLNGVKTTIELADLMKKEDEICIEMFRKYAQCLTRQEHMKLLDKWIAFYKEKIGTAKIVHLDDSSKFIFIKLYLKDRAFKQKEDLYLNRN
jgi:hypothetical protein